MKQAEVLSLVLTQGCEALEKCTSWEMLADTQKKNIDRKSTVKSMVSQATTTIKDVDRNIAALSKSVQHMSDSIEKANIQPMNPPKERLSKKAKVAAIFTHMPAAWSVQEFIMDGFNKAFDEWTGQMSMPFIVKDSGFPDPLLGLKIVSILFPFLLKIKLLSHLALDLLPTCFGAKRLPSFYLVSSWLVVRSSLQHGDSFALIPYPYSHIPFSLAGQCQRRSHGVGHPK